jgi:hypothetical protein
MIDFIWLKSYIDGVIPKPGVFQPGGGSSVQRMDSRAREQLRARSRACLGMTADPGWNEAGRRGGSQYFQ